MLKPYDWNWRTETQFYLPVKVQFCINAWDILVLFQLPKMVFQTKLTPKAWLGRHVVKEDNWERSFVPSQSKMVSWGNLPVIQAIPPPCLKDKEWLYCCIARRIAGTPKWQLTIERCIFGKEKYEIFRREWEWGDDGWIRYFCWHANPLLDYLCELPIE